MESCAVDGDRKSRIRQVFHHVAGLQKVLTIAVRRQPPGRGVGEKWIIEELRQLVAHAGYILKGVAEEDKRCNPAGKVHHKATFAIAVLRSSRKRNKGVKSNS